MQSKKDQDFMFLAIKQAKKAKVAGNLPFGAVVVHKSKVIGSGKAEDNSTKEVTSHAELNALRVACAKLKTDNLQDCTIYCTNEPCIMCAAGIFQAGIPRVVIGASRTNLSHILRSRKLSIDDLIKDSGHKIEITREVLKAEVLELFADVKK